MKAWSPASGRARRESRPVPLRPRAVSQCGDAARPADLVIAIPVCDEIERVVACIDALAATLARRPQAGVVLLVNNSVDASGPTAFCALAACGIKAIVVETTLAPAMATAGWARRLAVDIAARWALPDAVLMTTDADGRVAADRAEANLALLGQGAHLVCGRIATDSAEAALLPVGVAALYDVERAYTALAIELDALLDHRPHDPGRITGWRPGPASPSGHATTVRSGGCRRFPAARIAPLQRWSNGTTCASATATRRW